MQHPTQSAQRSLSAELETRLAGLSEAESITQAPEDQQPGRAAP